MLIQGLAMSLARNALSGCASESTGRNWQFNDHTVREIPQGPSGRDSMDLDSAFQAECGRRDPDKQPLPEVNIRILICTSTKAYMV